MTRPPPPQDKDAAARIGGPLRNALAVAMLILIALVLAAGVGWRYWRNGEARQSQRPPASAALATAERPFTLVDPTGRPVTDRDFRGKFMLIYFGYSACADHCPTMLMTAAGALKALGSRASQVQPIFITVDPAHDTPAIVGRYASKFSPRILGLTGSPSQIESVEKAYGVQTLFRHTGPEAGAYVIDHPSGFYLVGPDGRFITELQADGGPDDLAARIQRLL